MRKAMPRYSTSKLRLILLTFMFGAVVFVVGSSFGQNAAAPGGGAAATPAAPAPTGATPTNVTQSTNLIQLILRNLDFVFVIIAILSIWGVTLIIRGFIQNRAAVMLPEQTTNRIREMIE